MKFCLKKLTETVVEKKHQHTPQTIYRNQIIIILLFYILLGGSMSV